MESRSKSESDESYYKLPPIMMNNKETPGIGKNGDKLDKEENGSGKGDESFEENSFTRGEKAKFNQVVSTGVKFIVRKSKWVWHNEKLPNLEKYEKLRIMTVTWNMAGREPIDNIEPLFKTNNVKHHIYVVSTQECCNSIQKSFVCNSKNKWRESLGKVFDRDYFNPAFVSSNAMALTVFIHNSLKKYTKNIRTQKINTGFMGFMANKGCTAISFDIGEEKILCVGSHLTSGRKKFKKRNKDVEKIRKYLKIPYVSIDADLDEEKEMTELKLDKNNTEEVSIKSSESTLNLNNKSNLKNRIKESSGKTPEERADHVIWCGDLNYRLEMDRFDVKMIARAMKYEKLLKNDQLLNLKSKGLVFQNYREKEITFPPSYKYKTHTNTFTDKNRVPSYTDRILFSGRKRHLMEIFTYDCESQIVWSDHKPVFAQSEIPCKIDPNKKYLDDGRFDNSGCELI